MIHSCDIEGSSDSTIRNVVPNNLDVIFKEADIQAIYCNGAKSFEYYEKYQKKETGKEAVKLPSTSPANAAFSLERLKENWRQICVPLKAAPEGIGNILLNGMIITQEFCRGEANLRPTMSGFLRSCFSRPGWRP